MKNSFALALITLLAHPILGLVDHLDLAFELQLHRMPRECKQGKSEGHLCKLPYAVSILEAHNGDFDLGAVMLQEGHLRPSPSHQKRFREDTVVTLPRGYTDSKGAHVFVGIKIYGVPHSVQDYFIIDASKVLHGSNKVSMAVDTGAFSFSAILKAGKPALTYPSESGCTCVGYKCGCCEHMEVPKIELNAVACANVSYIPDDFGISVTFSLNGWVVYNETVSARNPPPLCFNAPYLKEYASLCLRFHDLDFDKNKLSGCLSVEAELYHVQVAKKELGCFHIGRGAPVGSASEEISDTDTPFARVLAELKKLKRKSRKSVKRLESDASLASDEDLD